MSIIQRMSNLLKFNTADAVEITASSFGNVKAQTVLLLHGAGQTRHSWEGTALALAKRDYHAITVDTRGHGESDWSDSGDYSIDTLVSDLHLIIEELADNADEPPLVIGASLGGISALLAQGESSSPLFKALVLVDITPRTDPEGVARILRFMTSNDKGFESLEQASAAVADYQLRRRRSRSGNSSGLLKNLRLGHDNRYYWHWDPRLMNHVSDFGPAFVERQNKAAANLRLPVLLVRGRLSEVVDTDAADEFLQIVPHAHYIDVKDAAHMVATDDNEIFTASLIEFLDSQLG